MGTVDISSSEEMTYNDFKEGNSVQVRVTVPPSEEHEYKKGKTVKIIYGEDESIGKIVSEPITVRTELEGGNEMLSLIVEKADQ